MKTKMTRDSKTVTYSKLLDELHTKVGPERYDAVRIQVADLAQKRTRALAKIRDKAFNDYCRAEHTYTTHWQEAWNAARDEILKDK